MPIRSSILLLVGIVLASGSAFAQTSTTGGIRGVVVDRATKQAAGGATVIATSPALQRERVEITDDTGSFYLQGLPPGVYQLEIIYTDARAIQKNVTVPVGKLVQTNVTVDSTTGKGEVIELVGEPPVIDQGSTKLGLTLTTDQITKLPSGRNPLENLDIVPTTTRDRYGIAFGGSSSFENVYIVDGLNTTTTAFQGAEWGGGNSFIALGLPNELLTETEVIAAGYGADFGGSTGGVINMVTKSGSNEFHGSVFGHFTPGGLQAAPRKILREGSSLSYERELSYRADFGAEVGGPLIKNTLWFHVGINPVVEDAPINRVVSRFRDADNDGIADVDPTTQITLRDQVAKTQIPTKREALNFTGKLSFAASPEHQGSLSVIGTPGRRQDVMSSDWGYGPIHTIASKSNEGQLGGTTQWTSKLGTRTQLDATLGFVHGRNDLDPRFADQNAPSIRFLYPRPFSDFSDHDAMPAECEDGANDPYPMLINCQVANYQIGGFDHIAHQTTDRFAGKLTATHRFVAGGHHLLKVGLDFEQNRAEVTRAFTGGGIRNWDYGGSLLRARYYSIDRNGSEPCGSDVDDDGTPDGTCSFVPTEIDASAATNDLAAFAQDSWQPISNLTILAGARWEQQRMGTPGNMVGLVSGATGEKVGPDAIVLDNLIAPRVGVVYDPTEEGRSRIYAHAGRYYETTPLDININGFGNQVIDIKIVDDTTCGDLLEPGALTCDESDPFFAGRFGGGTSLVAPGLDAQATDEVGAGVEYEVLPSLKVGMSYLHRDLVRAIEDVSTDGGATYVIANPGEVDQEAIDALNRDADDAEAAGNDARAAQLRFHARQAQGVAGFDKPKRTYDAITLTASTRSKHVFAIASYTYSRTRGNHPGLFNPETGQPSANLTSMYDLPELMANRYGPLQIDRPSSFKLDAYYEIQATKTDAFVIGLRGRLQSGRPTSVLGGNPYGQGESYVLGRGSGERTPLETALDGHLAYHRRLSKTTALEAYVDVFNMFDAQPATMLDEIWTYQNVNPVVGGDANDLRHVKVLDPMTGEPTAATVEATAKNPNFGRATEAAAPRAIRFGLAFTF